MTSPILCACPVCAAPLETPQPLTGGETLQCRSCGLAFSVLALPTRAAQPAGNLTGLDAANPTMTFTPRGVAAARPAAAAAEDPSAPTCTFAQTPLPRTPTPRLDAAAKSSILEEAAPPRPSSWGLIARVVGGCVAAIALVGLGALLAHAFGSAPSTQKQADGAPPAVPGASDGRAPARTAEASDPTAVASETAAQSNKLPAPAENTEPARRPPVRADGSLWIGLGVGNRALEIEGEDLDGQPLKLRDSLGKVVFLNFWGQWCPYCRQMYPYMNKLRDRMNGRKFVLLGVNSDAEKVQAKKAVQSERLRCRSWWDGAETGQPIMRQWAIVGEPITYVLDKDGIIRWRHEGVPHDLEELDRVVDDLVAQAEGKAPQETIKTPAQIRGDLANKAREKAQTEKDLQRIMDRFSKDKNRRN